MFWMWVGVVVAVLLVVGLLADRRRRGSVDARFAGGRAPRTGTETEYRVDNEVIRNGLGGHGTPS